MVGSLVLSLVSTARWAQVCGWAAGERRYADNATACPEQVDGRPKYGAEAADHKPNTL